MTQKKWLEQIGRVLEKVRSKRPLAHHITNYVTVNDRANITLVIRASPIMADDVSETADITAVSSMLVLNIDTLSERTIESTLVVGGQVNKTRIPVVFDPVGAGVSELRSQTTRRILEEMKISVLRGNLSRIRFVAGLDSRTRGMDVSEEDSRGGLQAAHDTAQGISKRLSCVTAVTGAIDIVTDGTRTLYLKSGVPALSGVTGADCMCSPLVGSFYGTTGGFPSVAAGGILCMGIARELATERAKEFSSGSFRIVPVDTVSHVSAEILEEGTKLDEA